MLVCNKHRETHRGDPVHPDDCEVCAFERLEEKYKEALERNRRVMQEVMSSSEKIRLNSVARAGYLLAPVDGAERLKNVALALEEQNRLRDRLSHALAALRHIARTCIECPDTAQFACYASADPPAGFAPIEDYDE